LHPASCMLYRPRSILNRPFPTFHSSILPTFHSSPFQNCKEFLEIGACGFHTKCFINVREIADLPGCSAGFCCQTTLIVKQPGRWEDQEIEASASLLSTKGGSTSCTLNGFSHLP
jgi:hypothetical protein